MAGNCFVGGIPECISNMVNLKYMNLQDNMLSGVLPESLSRNVELREIGLKGNQLTRPTKCVSFS